MGETLLHEVGTGLSACVREANAARELLHRHGVTVPAVSTNDRIRIALLGQYNAGKSTIVNALLGQRRAKTGDSPETRRAQHYELANYDIVDLPGGEARIEEQEEAMRALEGAHAVLYVVSSQTGLDYETFWSDLALLAERRTPFLLVVNDKQAHETEPDAEAFRKLVVSKYGPRSAQRLGARAPSIHWVQAARAEKGRLEDKPALADRSGIVPLELELARYVAENQPLLRDLSQLAPLRKELEQLQEKLSGKLDDPKHRTLTDLLARCDRIRETLSAAAVAMAEERISPLRDSIAASLSRRATSKNGGADDLGELCQTCYDGAVAAFRVLLDAELATLDAECSAPAGSDKRSVNPRIGGIGNVEQEKVDPGAILRRIAALVGPTERIVANVAKATAKRGAAAAAEGAAVQATRAAGKEAAERGAAQVGKATAKQGGGAAAKAVGPIITVAVAAWEIYDAFRKASREKAAIAAALREAEAKAALAATAVKDQFLGEAHELLRKYLGPVRKELQGALASSEAASRSTEGAVIEVSAARNALDDVIEALEERTRR